MSNRETLFVPDFVIRSTTAPAARPTSACRWRLYARLLYRVDRRAHANGANQSAAVVVHAVRSGYL